MGNSEPPGSGPAFWQNIRALYALDPHGNPDQHPSSTPTPDPQPPFAFPVNDPSYLPPVSSVAHTPSHAPGADIYSHHPWQIHSPADDTTRIYPSNPVPIERRSQSVDMGAHMAQVVASPSSHGVSGVPPWGSPLGSPTDRLQQVIAALAPRSSPLARSVTTPTEQLSSATSGTDWLSTSQSEWLSALLDEAVAGPSTTQPPNWPSPATTSAALGPNGGGAMTLSHDTSPVGRASASGSPHQSVISHSPAGSVPNPSPLGRTRSHTSVTAPDRSSASASRKKGKTPIVPINLLSSGARLRGRKKSAIILNLRPGAPTPAPLPHGAVFPGKLPPGVSVASAPPTATPVPIPAPPEPTSPDKPSGDESIDLEAEKDHETEKHRRNSLASAMLRSKKKSREATLEADARWLTQRVDELQSENQLLERENGWLRTGLLSKNPTLFTTVGRILQDASPGTAVQAFAQAVGPAKAASQGAPLPSIPSYPLAFEPEDDKIVLTDTESSAD